MNNCSIDGCTRQAAKRGWCNAHYKRWLRHGDPRGGAHWVDNSGGCSVEGCDRDATRKGLCNLHRQRLALRGEVGAGGSERPSRRPKVCTADGCEGERFQGGLCSLHAKREVRAVERSAPEGERCDAPGCTRRRGDGGWCELHGERIRRVGHWDADVVLRRVAATKFWDNVDRTGDCWLWTGKLHQAGYGLFNGQVLWSGQQFAHRIAVIWMRGPLPERMTVDHLCRTRNCVRADHLEVVTQGENARRGSKGRLKTVCRKGHPMADENVYVSPQGNRACRICLAVNVERRAVRRRAGVGTVRLYGHDLFLSKVDRNGPISGYAPDLGPCHLWTGKPDPFGYGRFRGYRAHREAWKFERGDIPDGLTVDHLCRVRLCVRVDHLEPVTGAENLRRMHTARQRG